MKEIEHDENGQTQEDQLGDDYYLDDDFDESILEEDLTDWEDDLELDEDAFWKKQGRSRDEAQEEERAFAAGAKDAETETKGAAAQRTGDGPREATKEEEQARQGSGDREMEPVAEGVEKMATQGAGSKKAGEIDLKVGPSKPDGKDKKTGGKKIKIACGAGLALLFAGAAFYVVKAQSYKDTFFRIP